MAAGRGIEPLRSFLDRITEFESDKHASHATRRDNVLSAHRPHGPFAGGILSTPHAALEAAPNHVAG